MNHSICDGCGGHVSAASKPRYEVKIEVKAAYDPLAISKEDLKRDFRAEIAKVLAQLEGLTSEEAQNQVYRTFDFDLCLSCQRRYIGSLLSGKFVPWVPHVGLNEN